MALRLSTFSLPIVKYIHFITLITMIIMIDDDDYFDDIDYHFGDVGSDDHSDGGFC